MILFSPFTGIDNHRRIVTFGSGLLSKEDVPSYSWLFSKFKDCMSRCPSMIITDQDPTMKNAIKDVLEDTRHRLCMWHITEIFLDKLPHHLKRETDLKRKIDAIIWSELIESIEFEERWAIVMNDFGLNDHTWFSQMFDKRKDWIPAYFRDFPLSGLLKTTSLSESVNSFFGKYPNTESNLVNFYMQFDSAMDAQRHAQDQLNCENASSTPELKTPLAIEKHALDTYTTKVFIETQFEIVDAYFKCRVLSIENEGVACAYKIDDGVNREFNVFYSRTDNTYLCSCKKFVRVGILCSHIFVLLRDFKIDAIPDKYILCRWTKVANLKASLEVGFDVHNKKSAYEENKLVKNQLYSEIYSCIGMVDGDIDKMNLVLNCLRECKKSISNESSPSHGAMAKRKLFANYYGWDVPDVVSVFPPAPVKTKGSGRRIKFSKEQAIAISKKRLRMCKNYNQKTNHDKRNCPKVPGNAS